MEGIPMPIAHELGGWSLTSHPGCYSWASSPWLPAERC